METKVLRFPDKNILNISTVVKPNLKCIFISMRNIFIKNSLSYELFFSISCTHVCLYLQYIPYLGKVSVHCCLNFKRSSIGNSPQSFCSSTTPYCSSLNHINYAQLRILLLFHKHHLLFFFSNGINGQN